MPRVAYYTRKNLSSDAAIPIFKEIARLAAKDMTKAEYKKALDALNVRCSEAAVIDAANSAHGITSITRIKQEVNTLDEVKAIEESTGFVRWAMGGFTSIYDLIKLRKAAGRSDWYV